MSAEADKPGANPDPRKPVDRAVVVQDNANTTPTENANSVPNISGSWQGKDDTVFVMQRYDDGTFDVESPGYGSGQGDFSPIWRASLKLSFLALGEANFRFLPVATDLGAGSLLMASRNSTP